MSFLGALLHHGIFLATVLVLSITQRLAGAQRLSPPPEPNPIFSRFNPPVSALGLLIAVVVLAIAVYSIYILHCSRAIASVGAGSSWAGRAIRGGMSRRGLGLDRAVIDTFPVLEYSAVKGMRLGKCALECAVCLNEFEDRDALRLLPNCDHVFHPDCIDEWLAFHSTCPVCRAELHPQSGESAARSAIVHVGTAPRDEQFIQVVVEESRNGAANRVQDGQEPACADNSPNLYNRCEPRSSRARGFARSHSTGHSLVQPGQDVDRFTLRLPAGVRKQVMDRAAASAVASSSSRGNRASGEGSSSSRGRFFRRPQLLDRAFKSDRWVLTRMSSLLMATPAGSPRMPSIGFAEGGSLGRSSRTKNKPSEPARSPV